MRVKKQKVNRRTVKFYKACFGFRQPFKILCDGTFVHYTRTNNMGSPHDLFSAILSAPAKAFITRCGLSELRKLGKSYSETVLAARRLNTSWCNHEPSKSASECLEDLVREGNPDHFFIASQDADLRQKIRQMPGVAIILAQNNFLILEPPSKQQQAYVRLSEAERIHVRERECIALESRERKQIQSAASAQSPTEDVEDIEEEKLNMATVPGSENKSHKQRKNFAIKDRPQFKRKRAKAPNPLSCKKKVAKPKQDNQSLVDSTNNPRSRKRRRRHHTKENLKQEI